MVCRMLEQLGLFVGSKKDDNNEALFFYRLNNWAAAIGFARYDYPHNLALMNPGCRKEIVDAFTYHLGSWRRRVFLGWKNAFRYRDIRDLDFPWGWKEPQNTFMLDFWKEVFPEAKVIHIYRNPIDSTVSFLHRDLTRYNRFSLNWKKKLKRDLLVSHKYHQNFRLGTLQDGYALWSEYVGKALSWEPVYGKRMMSVKYEDFLETPAELLAKLSAFSGLNPGSEEIEKVVSAVKAERKYAFLQHDDYCDFYRTIQDDPLMQQLGYNALITDTAS